MIKFNLAMMRFLLKLMMKFSFKSWIIKKILKKFKTLIFFHGNAGDLSNRIYKLNELNKLDINILLISWRGFSGNEGSQQKIIYMKMLKQQ